jgi:PAS domain S-box-containing protein
MGRCETDIADDETSRRKAAERALEAVRAELAEQVAARHEVQARLEQEVAQRDRIIAESAQNQASLRESEAAMRGLFDQNLDSMMIINLETGRYIDVNEEYIRHTGYRREDVIGQRSRELSSFANVDENKQLVAELKRVGVVRNMEATFRRKDGSTYSGLISALNTRFRGHLCCITITRDIGALKETQRQLIAAREAALEASRAKSDFLSSMSHEIRTPMNAVLGMADMLSEGDLNLEQRRYLDIIRSNGVTLLDLINNILDLAKVESGQLSFEEVDFDLRELVDSIAESMGPRAHQKHLELAAQVADDVPGTLAGDPLRLRQVIVNLLSNSVKFTAEGEIVLSVDMARPDTGSGTALIRFSVTDTGIGISPEKTDTIFDAFTQADSSTTRKYGGTGLGLTIVKRLVEMYRGEMTVNSKVGKGSTFSFTAEFRTHSALAEIALPAATVDLAGVRVLVVDDTAVNRMILQQALTSRGMLVTCVESGQAALDEIDRATAAGESYRAMLLDCRMPGMDGIEVVERIRARELPPADHLIILMLTSDDLSRTMTRAREAGIETYMIKPIKSADLFEALGRALGADRASSQSASHVDRGAGASASRSDVFDEVRPLRILLADDSRDNRLLVRAYFKKLPYTIDEAENGAAAVEKFKNGNYDLVLMDIDGRLLRHPGNPRDREQDRRSARPNPGAYRFRAHRGVEESTRCWMRRAHRQTGEKSHPAGGSTQGCRRCRRSKRRPWSVNRHSRAFRANCQSAAAWAPDSVRASSALRLSSSARRLAVSRRGNRRAEFIMKVSSDDTWMNAASGGLSNPIAASAIPTVSTAIVPTKF